MSVTFTQVMYSLMLIILLWGMYKAWHNATHTATIHPFKAIALLSLFYLSYLAFPALVLVIWQMWQGEINVVQFVSTTIILMILIYARFIEPQYVVVQETELKIDPKWPLQQTLKIALIADLHIGLYSGKEKQLKTIVEKINEEQPDFVVVAGDWTYEPKHTIAKEIAILKQIDVPIYSVTGNHDEQYPGPPIQQLLKQALTSNHIKDIENQVIEFDEIYLVGIGDLWAGKANMEFLKDLAEDKPILLLSHNPDTVEMVPQLATKPLMLSGHTHGGQIELPWLTDYVLKKVSILGHKKGYYSHANANVFVTVGTGMVGAPFRFRVPPTIDIIYLS